MLPNVVCENLVPGSSLSLESVPSQAIHHQGKRYTLNRVFTVHQRLEAYNLGCNLAEQGVPVLMTASRSRYAVWVEITSDYLPSATLNNAEVSVVEAA
ncbi:MAG: hypothetical protein KME16_18150 [Scytolyngbya sp. HA4215-MV1]|jgi:hypothetical protein|nr:hypothetical protein [Scytolyngbya sp. HA4215-MV1]